MNGEKNIAVICNPLAGAGRAVTLADRISFYLTTANIRHEVFKKDWPENFESFTDIFISGGDGTLNYFFNKYPGVSKPLVIFNGGTGNDVFSLLYKNKSFDEMMETALETKPSPVDAGKCNERLFINGAGIGFEGAVSKTLIGKNKSPGKTSFLIAILRKLFFYKSRKYKIVTKEYSKEGYYLLISVMNGHRAGGGFHIAPESAIDDGLLDVILVERLKPLMRLRWLPVIEKGRHLSLPFVKQLKTRKVTLTSDELIQLHLDGEYMEANRVEIELLPAKYFFRY